MLNRRTGNLFLALFFAFIGNFVFAQNRERVEIARKPGAASMRAGVFIDVNAPSYPESNYSITQLIKDVLISGGGCATSNVSNVTVSPNLQASNQNRSWGYFNKANTNFPFAKGIVLSTGYANKTGNTFQGSLSDDLGTGGDTDLANALAIANSNLTNSTFIEFDFVAASTEVTFKYIFASKEYQQNFPCTITDGFALLLRKVGDPNYINMAVLPGGAGPVSVTNIHPAYPNCGPKNEAYFGGINSSQIETNFDGRTIPLTAKATVIPGQTYHFKMVLADYQDPNFDSAVFLEAGSFDIGVKILDPAGVQLPASVNMCDNTPQTFTASVQGGVNVTYEWFLNNNLIPGATSASYTATQPGVYKVKVYIQGNSCPGEATITVVGGTSPTVQNATLTACYAAGNATFNLPLAQTAISTTPGAVFSYYTTLADANAGNASTIPNPAAYPNPGGQTVYVRVGNGFCYKVAELQLVKAPQMTASVAPPAGLTCTNSQITLDASASVYPTGSTFNWTTAGGNIVSGGTTLNPVINAPGTYTLTISKAYQPGNVICTAIANVTVTGDSAPPTTGLTASKIKICKGESVTLTASGGVTYNWTGLPGTGNTQTVSPTVTTTYTVTAVGANGCVSQNPGTITIEVSEPFTAQNATLHKCYQPGLVFDLTEAQTQITTAGGVTFTYYVNLADANAANGNFIATPTAYSPPGNQTIYVLVSNGGCRSVVSLQLLRTAETTLTIAAPQTITCTTAQVTLNASASVIPTGSTITWTTTGGTIVSGANTLTPVVSAGGVYTLTVTNISQPGNLSCAYTSSVTVQQDTAVPVAALVSSQPRICLGESVTLTASGGVTYNWGNGLPGNGNTQVVSPTNTTVYTVYAVGANGCISATPATVTVQVGPPVAGIAASKTKICAGESVTLTATGGITYNWVGLPGNGNTQVVTPTITTMYSVYALGGNGCSSVDPATIEIEVVPAIVSTLKDVYACAGDSATLDAGTGPNYTYLWSTGATTQTITTNVAGTYSVTISNGVCSKTFSAQLINPDLPQFTNIVYNNHVLTLTASNPTGGVLEYSIDGGVTWQDSNVFYGVLNNATYYLMVRVKEAKCGTSLNYFTFVISNAITPNMDGVNDSIDFTGISGYNNFAASIFDRYGAEVFKATKSDAVWRGSVKGITLPSATYWYRVQWENPASKNLEQRSGWILLKNRN